MKELKERTEEYIARVDGLLAARKFGEGVFGLPDSAKDSLCHKEYFEAVRAHVHELAASGPSEKDAADAAEFLLRAHKEYPASDLAAWMLLSVQQFAGELMPFLTKEKKKELASWYEREYPRRSRMPVQDEVLRLLRK